jgi:NADH-quinone oxidoreductase subunit G
VNTLNLVTLTINDREVQVEEGTSILKAAEKLDIHIPVLCHFKLHDDRTNK